MKYELLIKQEKSNKKNITFSHLMAAFLIIIMGAVTYMAVNAIKFAAQVTVDHDDIFKIISGLYILSGIILLIIIIKYNKRIIQNKRNSNILRIIELLLLLPILLYSYQKAWYLPVGYSTIGILGIIYAFYIENSARKQFKVTIENSGIIINQEKNKILNWHHIIKLIVRHNILTIEGSGNKLYQYDLLANQKYNTNEIEAFALKKIKEEKRIIENDW